MPKQLLEINNFAGGLNSYSDPRDIQDGEFQQNWNAIVDKAGIIRVAGMGEHNILTEYHTNENFQAGYGLFQFSSDYSVNEVDGKFASGIKTGTASAGANSSITLETTATASTNEYANMTIFIYSGTGKGQTRRISSNTNATPPVISITPDWTTNADNTSKYIIYKWHTSSNWDGKDGATAYKDVITNGGVNDESYLASIPTQSDNYYIYSKKASITDNESSNLGYMEYKGNITIKPGIQYYLSFDCAAKDKWYNMISDGSENGSGTTHGDKVPWVQLYSEQAADTKGSIKTFEDQSSYVVTPTSGESTLVGGAWNGDFTNSWLGVLELVTVTGNGSGASFWVYQNGADLPEISVLYGNAGEGYADGDILRIYDPNATDNSKYCILEVATVNRAGLSLHDNIWVNGSEQPNYITEVEANYIDNGDFADGVPSHNGTANEWTEVDANAVLTCVELGAIANTNVVSNESEVSISTSAVTLTVDTTDATDALLKNKRIYKSDGTFIGKCTSVNSIYEIVLDGAKVAIPNDTTLYAGNQHDQSSYGEDAGTCKMTSTGAMNFSGGPESYIYQNLTLDVGVPYHLNFLYDSPTGIMYKIENTTTSQDIIPWTVLGTSRKIVGKERYVFGGALYNTKSKDVADDYTMNYIKFIVSGASNSDTIQIKFAPSQPSSYVSLHGVTVYKAHNDLVTMSYNKEASNPFGNGIESFSNYSMSFILPDSYTEASDWVLRLYAGQYGYRASNNINLVDSNKASNGQEVYFDNIRLTSEEGDTVTLLSNNATTYSQISLHSSLTNTWDLDFLRMEGLKSKPVYNYINGMLKISDANFSNSNGNFLAYYDKLRGWRKISNPVPSPPNINARDVSADDVEYVKYDAIETSKDENGNAISFLNKYFEGENFWGYNWSLEQYGPDAHHGLVIRYFRATDCLSSNAGWEDLPTRGRLRRDDGSIFSGSQSFLYNVNSDYYINAFVGGNDTYGINPGLDSILNTGGMSSASSYSLGSFHTDNTDENFRAHNPLYFVIKGKDLDNYLGMDDVQPSSSGDVKTIKLNIDWMMQGCVTNHYSHASSICPPFFKVRVGKIEQGYNGNLKSDLINGNDIPFNINYEKNQQIGCDTNQQNPNTHGWMILADNPVGVYYGGNNGVTFEENWRNTWFVEDVMPGAANSVDIEAMTMDANYNSTARANIRFNVEFGYDLGEIERTDDILVSIEVKKADNVIQYSSSLAKNYGVFIGGDGQRFSNNAFTNITGTPGNDTSFVAQYVNSNYQPHLDAHDTSYYERLKINNAKVEFYSKDILEQDESSISPGETSVKFSWAKPDGTTAMGWGGRKFIVGASSVNIFEEESSIMSSNITIGESSTGLSIIQPGFSPNIVIDMSNNYFDDNFLSKTKFYLKDTESDIWYMQFYIDHKTKILHTTISGVTSKPNVNINRNKVQWIIERENIKNFNEVNSYESETTISQEDGKSNSNLTCRYKTSVVANNRLYVGNILQNGEIMSDRMIKSPIGKYNLLPKSNFIDVAINDGDEITALAFYKDKLLQFKKRKVFVISTSGDYEFLEDTFDNIGAKFQASVCTTPYGIVWANKSGLYLYDGKQLKNLIENKIAVDSNYSSITNNFWRTSDSSYSNNPALGFDEQYDILIIKFTANSITGTSPDAATYHFGTNSFTFNSRSIAGDGQQANSGEISNMITNQDGKILYYRYIATDSVVTAYNNSIKKWTHTPVADSTAKLFYFTTKDFTFGNIAVRKKLYKVYITYKTNSDSNVAVTGAVDGNSSYNVAFSTNSKFKGTNTACYGSSTLDSTSNEWKIAELKFDNPSLVNNVYSFRLQISSGIVASDFEINDISISYKTKRVK